MTEETCLEYVRAVAQSPSCAFYRTLWTCEPESMHALPLLSPSRLADTPLEERTYERGSALVKMISRKESFFLYRSLLSGIRVKHYPRPHARPLVLITDVREAIEQCLRLYAMDRIPLMGEVQNMPLAQYMAVHYEVDSVVADVHSLSAFLAEIPETIHVGNLMLELHIAGRHDVDASRTLRSLFRESHTLLVFPETGLLGGVCIHGESMTVHATPDVFMEMEGGELIVTKFGGSFPFIRYQTGIRVSSFSPCLVCGQNGFRLE